MATPEIIPSKIGVPVVFCWVRDTETNAWIWAEKIWKPTAPTLSDMYGDHYLACGYAVYPGGDEMTVHWIHVFDELAGEFVNINKAGLVVTASSNLRTASGVIETRIYNDRYHYEGLRP